MTNLERIKSLLGFSPAVNAAEAALTDRGVTPSGTYDSSNIRTIKMAAIEVMEALLTTADFADSATGAQTKYDRQAVEKRIATLKEELGLSSASQPKIRAVNPW